MRRASVLLPVLLCGCAWFGWFRDEAPERTPVQDANVIAFAERAESFYRALERIPLDVLMTFDDAELRAFFVDADAFADYYAGLADQVRGAQLRNSQVEQFVIREFRFEAPELAKVDLELVGHHERSLRFWEIRLARTDTWSLVGGRWLVTPEKL